MGLLSFFRRLSKERVTSPDFAQSVAETTVRVATDQQATRPLMTKLQEEGTSASEEQIRRELAFLLHYLTYLVILKSLQDSRKGSLVFQQVTDRLVAHLNDEGLWPADRGRELEQTYYRRQEEFTQRLESSKTASMSEVVHQATLVTLGALFEDSEEDQSAVESQLELLSLAEGYYERMEDVADRVWIDLEERPVVWPQA